MDSPLDLQQFLMSSDGTISRNSDFMSGFALYDSVMHKDFLALCFSNEEPQHSIVFKAAAFWSELSFC